MSEHNDVHVLCMKMNENIELVMNKTSMCGQLMNETI